MACHRLNVDARYPPVRQKARRIAPEWQEAVKDEVQKLLDVGFIREV